MNALQVNRLLNFAFGFIALLAGISMVIDERTRYIGAVIVVLALVYLGVVIRRMMARR